ncbi:hypothetical protein [Streptomyces sp. 147326]|uniref:cupin domain-containing protein n=1 Tax=Streptomyces sp. 147326 TaxID=3074379 RepID=UPI0038579E82
MWTRLSADTVPEAERFEWFNDVVSSSLMPTALASDRSADFHAAAAVLDLGAVQVSSFEYAHVRSRRTPALIRRGDPEQYQLSLLTRGRMWMSQCGGEAELAPGDMILWDTSHPFEADCRPGKGTLGALVVQLPRTALPLRAGRIDPLLGRRIGAESGMAAILAQFLTSLGTHGSECSPQELQRLGTVAVPPRGSARRSPCRRPIQPLRRLRSGVRGEAPGPGGAGLVGSRARGELASPTASRRTA